jgi:hypothetical protein
MRWNTTQLYQWQKTSDFHAWNTDGSERLRLDSTGRLGLGTSSPQQQLSVGANLHLYSGASNNTVTATATIRGTTNLILNAGADSDTYINFDRGRHVILNTGAATGNVGIGTTNPLANCVISDGANGVEIAPGVSSSTVSQITSYNRSSNAYSNFNFDAASTRFSISGSEKARIDSSGRLLVGTSTARQSRIGTNGFQTQLQLESDGTTTGIAVSRFNNASGSGYLSLQKARGTGAAPVIVVANDTTGRIMFSGWDGANFTNSAFIESEVDGTPGTDDMPGRLMFSTTADGGTVPTERLRITSAGVLQIADAGNITVGTTTGTKIGTATTQKLGFYNATPVVQPTAVADATDAATAISQLNALLAHMRTLGLIAT